tara:strand:+ start:1882 stop:2274 length:393 start_codon:yes stop_codon:yes gene_type:complete
MQKIYNKLAKQTPAKLSKRSVKLGKVDDLTTQLDEYVEEMNQIALNCENALTDVSRAIGELRILQEAKIPEIAFQADELLNQVFDLGIDVPEELQELDQKAVDATTIQVDAYDIFDGIEKLRTDLYPFMK